MAPILDAGWVGQGALLLPLLLGQSSGRAIGGVTEVLEFGFVSRNPMPANLTPQYHRAELEFRRAQTAAEQAECLQRMLQLIPRHKGTERLQADLKTRLKETRLRIQQEAAQGGRSSPLGRMPRQGAGRIVLIGAPNSGKSRILRALTRAEPEVSPWPFTTRDPLPGMMAWRDVRVQLIDTPPIAGGSLDTWLLNLIRSADGVALVFDGRSDDAVPETSGVLQALRQRGVCLSTASGFAENDPRAFQVRTLVVATSADDPDCDLRLDMFREQSGGELPVQRVELDRPGSVAGLADALFDLLQVIRVYTRKPGGDVAETDPVTIPRGGTVEDLALQLHEELFQRLSWARVWGQNVHDGQTVGPQHVLSDSDIVELH